MAGGTEGGSRLRSFDHALQFIEQWPLPAEDLAPRLIEREPPGAVHFRVASLPEFERIAADRVRVAIALRRPRVHDLPARLAHRSECRESLERQIESGLLAELALRRRE